MALRLVLDVNVWVNHYLSLSRGKPLASAGKLVRVALEGHCRLGPVQLVASHAMLDTLATVLLRIGLDEFQAQSARDAAEGACLAGALGLPPYGVPGGAGVQPMQDEEDGGVLDVALAARADLLVTNNLADFTPGTRADVDARAVTTEVLLLRHPRVAHGLAIATVFAASAWLPAGISPPPGVLARFMPSAARPSPLPPP